MKQYKARSGRILFKPSIAELHEMEKDNKGFCLACKNEEEGCEPDAVRYLCTQCGETKVYGAESLALRNLCY